MDKFFLVFFLFFSSYLVGENSTLPPYHYYVFEGNFTFSDGLQHNTLCDIPQDSDLFKNIVQYCLESGFKKDLFDLSCIYFFWGVLPEIHDIQGVFFSQQTFSSDDYVLVSITEKHLKIITPKKIDTNF